jgi:N utilization substance protein B
MNNTDVPNKNDRDPRHLAREYAFQFLYQCEMERIFHFSESHFTSFADHHQIDPNIKAKARQLGEFVLDDLADIDRLLSEHAQHWSLERIATIERSILRLATAELKNATAPVKVIINEAIELGKKFGTADSHKIINGIVNRIGHEISIKTQKKT